MDYWMSHINNEITARLDSQETQTRKETMTTLDGHNAFTGKEETIIEKKIPRQRGADKVSTCRDHLTNQSSLDPPQTLLSCK